MSASARRKAARHPRPVVATRAARALSAPVVDVDSRGEDESELLVPVPLALSRLNPDALAAIEQLIRTSRTVKDNLRRRDRAVRAARDAGASWAAIGLALGVTAEAARLKYRDAP